MNLQHSSHHVFRDWGIALVVCAGIHVAYGFLQPRLALQDGLAWDATHYYNLAQQFRDGVHPLTGPRPFAYRMGTAWIAAQLPIPDLRDAFEAVNLAFSTGAFVLMFALLRRLFGGVALPLALSSLLLMHHQTARLIFYYPVLTDPAAMFFSLLILVLGLRNPSWRWFDALAVTAACLAAAFFRETVVLAPACLLAASVIQCPSWRELGRRLAIRSIPLLAVLAGIWLTHQIVQTQPTPYTFLHAVRWSWNDNATKPLKFAMAVVLNAGPLIYVPLVCFPYLDLFRRQANFALFLYAFGTLVLAWVGGWHTDRFVSWGVIAYLPLVGIAAHGLLQDGPSRWKPWLLLTPLTIAHLLANYVWVAIPQAKDHNLWAAPDQGQIHRVWFAAYGEDLTVWHFHAVGMGEALQRQIGGQCLALLLFAVAAGAWLAWDIRQSRRRQG